VTSEIELIQLSLVTLLASHEKIAMLYLMSTPIIHTKILNPRQTNRGLTFSHDKNCLYLIIRSFAQMSNEQNQITIINNKMHILCN